MRFRSVRALAVCALVCVLTLVPRADTAVQSLPFSQDWSNTTLIVTDDNWGAVPGIVGYRGDGMTGGTGVNPQTVLAEAGPAGAVLDVNPNQGNPNTFATGGVAEFHLTDPVVALNGSGTARAPHLVISINTIGLSNVHVAYNLRDLDGSADNSVQPVALQFRVGDSGSYTNVPAGFVADASSGPSQATLVTPVSVDLPAATANQPVVQIRIITTDAVGNDEWIGVDDVLVTGSTTPGDAAPAVVSITPADGATAVAVDSTIAVSFTEAVTAQPGAFALACAGTPQTFTQSPSPSDTFTLTPSSPLPHQATCVVTVSASAIADVDTDDPPDVMAADRSISFTTVAAPPDDSDSVIVISQVYGGGGNTGATYRNDFVELYNRGAATIDITGWSVQYASATGTSWTNKQMLAGTIAPGQYYLIALASGGAVGAFLPEPNSDGGINMSATAGKVALVDNGDELAGACPLPNTHVMDFVGYGSTASCREGGTNAPGGSNTTAIIRKDGGVIDTDTNGADFVAGTPLPRRTAPFVEVGPSVVFTDPGTNGVNAPRDATIEISFSEPVDVIGAWFAINCAVSGTHTSATFASTTLTRYITPNDNFTAGEQCTVTIFKDQVTDQDLDDAGANTNTLPANHVWSFTVADGAAPPFPPSVHLAMGKPSNATASVDAPTDFLMEKPEYALSYNRDLGRPNWVSWHLSQEWIGTLARVDTFRPDPGIPPDWYRVQSFDFSGSGFDRGHMVPNADRDPETSIPINQATFLMSNMLAQAPDNNQGPWASLENYLRTLLPANELYIVAGGTGVGGTGSTGVFTTTLAGGQVTVPAATWKVALVIPAGGGDDVSRATCTSRTLAVLMPNSNSAGFRNAPWENYLTTVDAIETLTGYDFFSSLPAAVQRCLEAGINGVNPPNVPVFSALASPTIEAGTATVAISGILSVAGLAPSGTVAVTLAGVTVNAPIGADGGFTATLPANTLSTANSPYAIGFSYAGDANFTAASGSSSLTVIDTTGPAIGSVTTTPDELGAPNHKMVDVRVEYSVTDFSGQPSCTLSVASNEPIDGTGDGHTSEDWRVVDANRVQVRAERAGGGHGRVYTITIRCADASGNVSTGVGTVRVSK